ncbi:MAG: C40 family peptidase, partial [Bacteroidales bacterium]|nr:C40 family peptidase [Bacteroidales bacterium]
MHFGFCDLAVVPVRREPSDKAELSTQLVFGDLVEILEQSGSWLRVRNYYDDYEGWIDAKQVQSINENEFSRLTAAKHFVNGQLYGDSVRCGGRMIHLPDGCSFYDLKGEVTLINEQPYVIEGKARPFHFSGIEKLIETALSYLNCPYLWGGKTYLGLDCSGLTQAVYKQHGIKILRDAAQQATQGELISFISDGKPGDLVFFDNKEGKIIHVGILLDNQKVLHCSGKVRIDDIDHQGIFN